MSGPAYPGWKHLRFDGDRDAGQRYLPIARKVLGFALQEAARNGLLTYTHTERLDDGAIIVGEVRGGQPRVTITVPPGGGETPPITLPDRFVVWPRNASLPDGIDAEQPRLILDPSWKTSFFNSAIAGYDAFAGKKGTYVGSLPDGLRFAGNVDWLGRRGERIQWYGPSSRYWYDPHIQPATQYGKFVFMLGKKLLDVEAYIADSEEDEPFPERWVMGAALRGNKLVTMQAELPVGTTDTTPICANAADMSNPWPVGDVSLITCEYLLVADDTPGFLRVQPDSRTVLWAGTLANALNPWFFNQSATQAVSIGLPANVIAQQHIDAPSTYTLRSPAPSPSQQAHTLNLLPDEDPAVSSTSISLPAGGGTATLAADFVGDEFREMTITRAPGTELADEFTAHMGGASWTLATGLFLGVIDTRASYRVTARFLLFADIREQVAIVHLSTRVARINTTPLDVYESVEIWRRGVKVGEIPLDLPAMDTGWLRSINFLPNLSDGIADTLGIVSGVALAPQFALYQAYTAYQTPGQRFLWQGGHGLIAYLAYAASERFGAVRWNFTSGGSGTDRLDNYTDDTTIQTRPDFDGNVSVLGCATTEGITMLSCYGFEFNTGRSVYYVDGGDLGELTGVSGEDARYHPIWLLGKQQIQPTA